MTCQEWQTQIALYAGGDLDRVEAAAVEAHVSACAECAASLEEFESNHDAIKALWSEPLPQYALDAVRGNVLGNLRRGSPVWGTLLKYAAALVFVVGSAWMIRTMRVERAPVEHAKVPERVMPPARVPAAQVEVHAAVKRAHRKFARAKPDQKREPMLIRLTTSDPNVVIYWISD
jgi:anti-sigma factor RsiW